MAVSAKAAQEFVPIQEIRDGTIIMKDGTMKAVLMASSLNLALKSPDEQEAIILQFQNFLNSLDFAIQICVQSRKYDIRPYIALLENQEKHQLNDLLRIQIREYVNFIKNFTDKTNIMSKSFFIVVSYKPQAFSSQASEGFLRKLLGKSGKVSGVEKLADFENNKSQLGQRVYVIQQGVIRCGIRTVSLGTDELVELFYRIFNPGEQEKPIQPEDAK